MAAKVKTKGQRKGRRAGQITSVVAPAPLDPLESAVARLNQINYGLSLALHQQLIDRQFAHAMDDKSPKQGLAWTALQEWRRIDVVTAGKTLDLMAGQLNQQKQPVVQVSDQECALQVARLLESLPAEPDDVDARGGAVVPFGSDAKGHGQAGTRRRPTGTDVVVALEDA